MAICFSEMSKCSWTSYLCVLLVRACGAIRESGNLLGQEQRYNGKSSSASIYFRDPELWTLHFSALHWNHSRIVYTSLQTRGRKSRWTYVSCNIIVIDTIPPRQNTLLVIAWNNLVNIARWISVWRNAKRRLNVCYYWIAAMVLYD